VPEKEREKSRSSISQSIPFISGSDIFYSAVMMGFLRRPFRFFDFYSPVMDFCGSPDLGFRFGFLNWIFKGGIFNAHLRGSILGFVIRAVLCHVFRAYGHVSAATLHLAFSLHWATPLHRILTIFHFG